MTHPMRAAALVTLVALSTAPGNMKPLAFASELQDTQAHPGATPSPPQGTAPRELHAPSPPPEREESRTVDRESCEWKVFSTFAFNRQGLDLELVIDQSGAIATGEAKLNFYGNWCGPKYPAPGTNPEPIDALDRACMRHDRCYERRGFSNCECDQELLDALAALHRKRLDTLRCRKDGKWTTVPNPVHGLIVQQFATSPCTGGCKTAGDVKTCG